MRVHVRAAAYIRVSKEKAGQISPDAQRHEIAEYCKEKGWVLTEYFEDLDWSATKHKPLEMPGFAEMVRRAEDGEFDVVVFWRVDRAVREHTGDFQLVRASLHRSGVEMAFVGREYDESPEGDFAFGLDTILSRLESRRLGVRLRSMHAHLARQGKYAGNQAPFGWERVRDPDGQQRLVLDPEEAPWRLKMHEWYQRGWSLRAIARELNSHGVRTRRGAAWSQAALRKALVSPVQVGVRVVEGEEFATGRIEPLLDREVFERTLALMEARRTGPLPGRPSRHPIPSGLLRCGTCGARMYSAKTCASSSEGAVAYYACGSRTRGGLCTKGPHIREAVLLREVEPLLIRRLTRLALQGKREDSPVDLAPLRAQQEAIEISLARLAALYSEGELPEAEYRRAAEMQRRKLGRVREQLKRELGRLETEALKRALPPDRMTAEQWAMLSLEAKQDMYRMAIEKIVVNPEPTDRRIEVYWR